MPVPLALRRLALVAAVSLTGTAAAAEPPVDFNRQVRPLLSENCFACHGPDDKTRKADLRLDLKDGAAAVLTPGKPGESELVRRVTAAEPSQVMPPPKTGKKLSPQQIALLKQWVEQGANWSEHWAFIPPTRPPVPAIPDPQSAVRNPIDNFILDRLNKQGMRASPEADRVTLIRRVTLDLTGLPPTPEEVDACLKDDRPGAYERVVDRLLASPRYGERMALEWLDAARFADTHGYHIDSGRDMTRWREWVINAFNANKP